MQVLGSSPFDGATSGEAYRASATPMKGGSRRRRTSKRVGKKFKYGGTAKKYGGKHRRSSSRRRR